MSKPLVADLSSLLDEIESANPFRGETLARKLASYGDIAREQREVARASQAEILATQMATLTAQAAEFQKMTEAVLERQNEVLRIVETAAAEADKLRALVTPEVEALRAQQSELQRIVETAAAEAEKLCTVVAPEIDALRVQQSELLRIVEAAAGDMEKLRELLTPQMEEPLSPGKAQAEGSAGGLAPPRTPMEWRLVEIWKEVLDRPEVGIDDNFFDLGGDSMLSLQVVARAQEAGIEITSNQLFQQATVRGLAAVAGTAVEAAEPEAMIDEESSHHKHRGA